MLAYREERTLFHSIDPISKFAWLSITSLWLLSLQDLQSILLWCGGLVTFVTLGAKMNPLKHLRIAGIVLIGGINLVLFQGLFREGEGFDVGWFHLSYSGIILGVVLAIRTLGILWCSVAFSQTTEPKMVALSLTKLKMPYKYAHLAYLALRFIPILEADLGMIGDTLKLRGITNPWKKVRMITVALIATEVRRTEEIAIALETRAFSLHPKRTDLDDVVISKKGLVLIALTLGAITWHLSTILLST